MFNFSLSFSFALPPKRTRSIYIYISISFRNGMIRFAAAFKLKLGFDASCQPKDGC